MYMAVLPSKKRVSTCYSSGFGREGKGGIRDSDSSAASLRFIRIFQIPSVPKFSGCLFHLPYRFRRSSLQEKGSC